MPTEKGSREANGSALGSVRPSNLIEKSIKPPAPANLKPPPVPPRVIPGQPSKKG